jgi:hypothetical protein
LGRTPTEHGGERARAATGEEGWGCQQATRLDYIMHVLECCHNVPTCS